MRKVLVRFVKEKLALSWRTLTAFIKQYSLRLLVLTAVGVSLLAVFVNTYTPVTPSAECDSKYVIATNLQNGTVSECSQTSTFAHFISNITPLLCLLSLAVFIWLLARGAKAQIIHRKQWSWFRLFFYIYYGTLVALVFTNTSLDARKALLISGGAVALTHLTLFLIYKARRRQILDETFHYASATVGAEYDLLDFDEAASNFRNGLLLLDLPVQVVALSGVMGEGKSTFWRMTAEGFNKDETMHTYISLTETNSKNDFSKLFAERWFETLKERYAFLLSGAYTEESRLYKILRDTDSGIIRLLSEAALSANVSLFRTKTQVTDPLSEIQNTPYVSSEVARIFSSIPEVYEKQWYIVVDELERAPLEEVYRLIEVIERFRQLGKDGLPVQLVFILCFDASHFQNLHASPSDSEHGEKAALVKDFLTNTSLKSVDIFQGVPVTSLNRRLQLVTEKIKQILPDKVFIASDGKPKYEFLDDLYDFEKNDFMDTSHVVEGQSDYKFKDTFDYLLIKLTRYPTRASVRLTQQVQFFISQFSEQDEEWLMNINLSTLMAYQYIRLLRPELLPFIGISYIHFDPDLKSFFTMHNGFLSGFRSGSGDEDKRTYKERIFDHTGIDTSIYEESELKAIVDDLEVLVPVVSKYLKDGLDPYSNDVVKYKGTLSDPDVLKWLLSNSRTESTEFGKFTKLYDKVPKGITIRDFESAQYLADFSGFARNRVSYTDKTHQNSLTIAKVIYDYMTKVKNLVEPSSIQMDRNVLDKLTYEFVFQIQEAAFGYEVPEVTQESAAGLFDEFMHNDKIKFESKLIAMDAFLDQDGSGLDRVRTREEVFEKYRGKDYFIRLFDEMKKDIVARYGQKNSPVTIYNQEANVFYVQFQMWNGVLEDPFLDEMRAIAKRGLASNAKALNVLWSVYPYDSKWTNYASIAKDRHTSLVSMTPSRRGMYVKLEEMLAFTRQNTAFRKLMSGDPELRAKVEFWARVHREGDYPKLETELTSENGTVGAKVRNRYDFLLKERLASEDPRP